MGALGSEVVAGEWSTNKAQSLQSHCTLPPPNGLCSSPRPPEGPDRPGGICRRGKRLARFGQEYLLQMIDLLATVSPSSGGQCLWLSGLACSVGAAEGGGIALGSHHSVLIKCTFFEERMGQGTTLTRNKARGVWPHPCCSPDQQSGNPIYFRS